MGVSTQARSHNLTRVIHTLSASLTKRWLSKRCKVSRLDLFLFFFSFFVSLLLSTFSTSCGLRCRPFSPPGTCLQFLWRIRFSITTARRLSSNVANSRTRAFRESIYAQEKSPRIYTTIHSGGLELTQLAYYVDAWEP